MYNFVFIFFNHLKRAIYEDVKNVCSSQIGVSKFLVSCNPIQAISGEYGADWTKEKINDYSFINLVENHKYSDAEWNNLFEEYDLFGRLKIK